MKKLILICMSASMRAVFILEGMTGDIIYTSYAHPINRETHLFFAKIY